MFLQAQIIVQLCFDMLAVTGKYGDSRHDDNRFWWNFLDKVQFWEIQNAKWIVWEI